MNHLKTFYIVVWLMDGTENADIVPELTLCHLCEVEDFTKREAFKRVLNAVVKHVEWYEKPKYNRSHDCLVVVKTGSYTICMDLLKKDVFLDYQKQNEQGDLIGQPELILQREIAEGQKTTTVIVGHSWDDDPNNGMPDFTEFDCVFLLDLGLGRRITSISTLPDLLGLNLQYLRYDYNLVERVPCAEHEVPELRSFSFSNKYERWQFQIVKSRIDNLTSDNSIHNNYGYVSEEEAQKIVAQCVQEKEARREANHRMLLDAEMASLSNVEDLLKHLKSRM